MGDVEEEGAEEATGLLCFKLVRFCSSLQSPKSGYYLKFGGDYYYYLLTFVVSQILLICINIYTHI